MKDKEIEYSLEDGKYLVELARKSILHFLTFNELLAKPKDAPKKFDNNSGVFITLKKVDEKGEKKLRGCIGYPLPIFPLVQATIEAAKNAAVSDPRFPTVQVEEMKEIAIEVSILTPPKRLNVKKPEEYLDRIKIGRDGLIMKRGGASGLLLPQVPVDWGWTVEEFLEHTCQKAWLPKDAWKDLKTEVHVFSGSIFEKLDPNGEVKRKEI